jgi:hypothetical protein
MADAAGKPRNEHLTCIQALRKLNHDSGILFFSLASPSKI